jgi:hypothetical protein
MREKEKREAASAIALSEEESQTDEKEKSRWHERLMRDFKILSVGAESIVSLLMPETTASLSTWKMTRFWRSSLPQRSTACTTASISLTWICSKR